MTRAACFDLDGCLVDSRFAICTAINHGRVAVGLPEAPLDALHRFIGPPLLESFLVMLTEDAAGAEAAGEPRDVAGAGDPAAVDRAHEALRAYRAVYLDIALTQTPVFDGIPEVLGELAARMPLAVVTSKPRAYAQPIVETVGLFDHFTGGVHGPALDAFAEPKAVKLAAAMAAMGVDDEPGDVVMVGDRHHDVAAGRACGTATIGVRWGVGSANELRDAGADHLVDRPPDISRLLLA